MRRFKRTLMIISVIISVLAILALAGTLIVGIYIYKNISFESDEKLFESSGKWESTSFYANERNKDSLSGDEYTPRLIETAGAIRKEFYSLDEISPYIIKGFVAVEDKIFYEHSGVDIKRTMLAAINLITKKEKAFGASTITQQVIKNISGDNEVKISRKLSEIIRARHIEKIYSKDAILELYLNVIPMSENCFGIGSASLAYFGKEPSELSVAEAATLIGIANAPSAYNPYSNPDECLRKRNTVLYVMYLDGIIGKGEYDRACLEEITVIPREERSDTVDSWFVERVIEDVSRDLAYKYNISSYAARMMLFGGGYSVYTTMDFEVQNILDDYFLNTSNFSDKINDGLNYAMVVTDSTSGDLVGIVGRVGEKSGNRLLSHASVSHIPGSVLKPLALYAPLIDRGVINYATVFDDVPLSFSETDGEIREYPKNSPMVYDGLVTVSEALTRSKNTVAMRLSSILGNKNIFNFLKDEIGFSTLVESEVTSEGKRLTDIASSPMALGQLTHGIPLTALTEAYSVFPSYGNKMKMRSYLYVDDYKGERVLTNEPRKTRIFKESTAKIMNMMLKNVVTDGTAKSITLKEFFDVAGKTGTSGGNKDKLFIGYTPYYTAGVWCGFETGGMSLLGISPTATEVFDRVMTEIHERVVDPSEDIRSFSTDGLLYLPYCKDSGEIYTEICKLDPRGSRIEYGYFSPDNIPTGECKTHIAVAYDSNSKGIALKGCPDENIVLISLIRVENRSFPKEIYVTDAEFVYRDIGAYTPVPRDDGLPYFYYEIPNGEYVGITDRKKQFNSGCKLH